MPTTHSRFVAADAPDGGLEASVEHVREHLSACTHPDDDECAYTDEVTIEQRPVDGGILVVGTIDREPDAPYLRDGYDPDADDTGHTFQRWAGPIR